VEATSKSVEKDDDAGGVLGRWTVDDRREPEALRSRNETPVEDDAQHARDRHDPKDASRSRCHDPLLSSSCRSLVLGSGFRKGDGEAGGTYTRPCLAASSILLGRPSGPHHRAQGSRTVRLSVSPLASTTLQVIRTLVGVFMTKWVPKVRT